jgi:PD-(D/E)XK endonuclease
MPNPRRYTDHQLRAAVAASTNWSAVMVAISKKPGSGTEKVKVVAERLGLDRSHFAYKRGFKPVPGVATPFRNAVRAGGQSGPSIAARWFLDRGYIVSVPLEPAPYDLVAESDEGLKRVQVKTTRQRQPNGRFLVEIARRVHDGTVLRNANGSRKAVPYNSDQVDYFFIVTPESMFLIPISVVAGFRRIVLDVKYAAFAV